MVQSKTELFDDELTAKADFFKVLSHPARLQILQFLADTESCISGDITEKLPLGRTTVNQHLKELEQAGLIQKHIYGTKTKYCLNPSKIKELQQSMQVLFESMNIENYKCK